MAVFNGVDSTATSSAPRQNLILSPAGAAPQKAGRQDTVRPVCRNERASCRQRFTDQPARDGAGSVRGTHAGSGKTPPARSIKLDILVLLLFGLNGSGHPGHQDLGPTGLCQREAQHHGGQGWLDYDQAFRQQVAADPSVRWNTLIPGLQASTILGRGTPTAGSFCTLCRGVDHTCLQCALTCLQPAPGLRIPTTRQGFSLPQGGGGQQIYVSHGTEETVYFPGNATIDMFACSVSNSIEPGTAPSHPTLISQLGHQWCTCHSYRRQPANYEPGIRLPTNVGPILLLIIL